MQASTSRSARHQKKEELQRIWPRAGESVVRESLVVRSEELFS